MAVQFNRYCRVIISKNDGKGDDLGQLKVEFKVGKDNQQALNQAEIKIYNLSKESVTKYKAKEYTRVVLEAGYQENWGVIFDGEIRQAKDAFLNGVDRVFQILAADGDSAYHNSIVYTTIAAGANFNTVANAAIASMGKYGVKAGTVDIKNNKPLPRGKVLFGKAKDILRGVATNENTTYSIQDGRVQLIPRNHALNGKAVVINSETGMIGTAEQTTDGIKVRALINPLLAVGGLVKINNDALLAGRLAFVSEADKQKKLAPISVDGVYKIIKIEYVGDTRGNDWYNDMILWDVGSNPPQSKKTTKKPSKKAKKDEE